MRGRKTRSGTTSERWDEREENEMSDNEMSDSEMSEMSNDEGCKISNR
jgi:hypothetical protein